ncbi:hypothetical protein [Catellatospora vulcania]|uniref:hypothetical protein n=1 Tax=Catellatospora vulcania TaxID=1460450 RepID=UPI0012D40861|nr:hypothetical protein [Catellatospora vulcania]
MTKRSSVQIATCVVPNSTEQPVLTVSGSGTSLTTVVCKPAASHHDRQVWTMEETTETRGDEATGLRLVTYRTFTMTIGKQVMALTRPSAKQPLVVKPYVSGGAAQIWYDVLNRSSTNFTLGSADSTPICIDLQDSKTKDGSPVCAYPLNNPFTANQAWQLKWLNDLPGSHIPQQYDIANLLLSEATKNPQFRAMLIADPARTFTDAGYPLHIEDYTGFNNFFRSHKPLMQALAGGAEATVTADWRCIVCQIGLYSAAAILVGIGAVGLALLTPTTPIVVSIAATGVVTAPQALAFIVGLGALADFSVASVLTALCEWLNICD